MKITLTPPLRNAFERAAMEQTYQARLLDLCGSETRAKQLHDEWHRLHQPPIHPWLTWNAIARIEANINLLPSERKLTSYVVEFEI